MEAGVFANQYIFDGTHIGKQADVLKSAGDAQLGDLKGFEFGDVMTIEDQFAACDGIDASHGVEESCLAGTIGSDQSGDHPFFDDEINIVYGSQTAEHFGHSTSFKEVHD